MSALYYFVFLGRVDKKMNSGVLFLGSFFSLLFFLSQWVFILKIKMVRVSASGFFIQLGG